MPGWLFAAQPEDDAGAIDAGAISDDKVSLNILTALIINHDPALEALRGAIADADFRVATANQGRDPEIRVQYGELDGWSVPGPYTETSSEVITKPGATPYTRETVTTVTPDKTSETVQETVSEHGAVSQESSQRRSYGRDAYPGRSSYAVQLRLFPRNPFLSSASRKREAATREHAKLALETALHRAALSVAGEHRRIQFMLAELKLMRRRGELLRANLKRLSELNSAHGITPADYHSQRTEALLHFSGLAELRMKISVASGALKARAALGEYDRIGYAGSLMPTTVDFRDLDLARLKAVALERNPKLGAVQAAGATIESDMQTLRAESIPWLSGVSLNYGADDADNGQTRDEWGVVAGVTLPMGAWLDRKPKTALKSRLGSIERQELLTRRQTVLALGSLCQSLVSGQEHWASFASSSAQIERDIKAQIEKIAGNDLAAHDTRLVLNESLIQIGLQRLRLARELDGLLFDLCGTVGCDFNELLRVGLKPPPPPADR